MIDLSVYLFPLDGVPEKLHHIFTLTVCGLEAFGPGDEDTLQSTRQTLSGKHLTNTDVIVKHDNKKTLVTKMSPLETLNMKGNNKIYILNTF